MAKKAPSSTARAATPPSVFDDLELVGEPVLPTAPLAQRGLVKPDSPGKPHDKGLPIWVYAGVAAAGVAAALLLMLVVNRPQGSSDAASASNQDAPGVARIESGPSAFPDPAPASGPSAFPEPAPDTSPPISPAGGLASSGMSSAPAQSLETVIQRLKDATVYIVIRINGKPVSSGSGFAIETSGDAVWVATNKHVVVPDLDEYPDGVNPREVRPEIRVVFRSGEPGREQELQAQIAAADMSEGIERDLAILHVRGVSNPPAPLDIRAGRPPSEGMAYRSGGFPGGRLLAGRNNPSITVTNGTISSLVRDDFNQLSLIKVDGALNPGNSGGPIIDEKTGAVLGVAVAKADASYAEKTGFVVPVARLRAALAGRVGAMRFKLNNPPVGTADLEVQAQLVDPKRQIRGVQIAAVPASSVRGFGPNPDGTWPLLPGGRPVAMNMDGQQPVASGRFQVAINGGDPEARKLLVQPIHLDPAGTPVYGEPEEIELPAEPGWITRGGLVQLIKALRKRSLSKLGPLIDPEESCRLVKDEDNYKLTLSVPGRKVFTLSPAVTKSRGVPLHNAPRSLAEVTGDFAALVRVTGDINPGAETIRGPNNRVIDFTFQGAGLLLYQDRDNFMRVERCARTLPGDPGLIDHLLIEIVRDGKQAIEPIYATVPEGDLTIIMLRRKGRIQCLISPDNRTIMQTKEYAFDFPETVRIGISASNVSRKHFDAQFEEFVIVDDKLKLDEEFAAQVAR